MEASGSRGLTGLSLFLLLFLLLLPAGLGCGSSRQVAGQAMVVTGAVVAAAALASSTDAVLISDDMTTTQIAYVSRPGFSTEDAALITAGAGLMAVGQALLATPDPAQPLPALPPSTTTQAGAAAGAQAPAQPSSAAVVDPALIRSACESALEE